MKHQIFAPIASTAALLIAASAVAQQPLAKFSGEGNGRTSDFSINGPWLLDWRVESEFPEIATTTMRLEGSSAEAGGIIAEVTGAGNGLKLFRASGTFYVSVEAQNAKWRIEVSEISEEWAKRLEQVTRDAADKGTRARRSDKQVVADSFSGWRAESDQSLVLIGTGPMNFRISFGAGGCPGLKQSETLAFVTPNTGNRDVYDSILLDDGTRCYFDQVSWIPR